MDSKNDNDASNASDGESTADYMISKSLKTKGKI
jgi:hypothetical protein